MVLCVETLIILTTNSPKNEGNTCGYGTSDKESEGRENCDVEDCFNTYAKEHYWANKAGKVDEFLRYYGTDEAKNHIAEFTKTE